MSDRMRDTEAAQTHASAATLADIIALVPCETPGRAEQEEIIARIGHLRPDGWKRGWQVYIRALFELAPEPALDADGRAQPKRYCCASLRQIAAHVGRGLAAVFAALKWMDAQGIMTSVRPGDSTWPAAAGKEGCLRAPTWGVLAALVARDNPQLRLPMHGTGFSAAIEPLSLPARFDGPHGGEPLSSSARSDSEPYSLPARLSAEPLSLRARLAEKPLSLGGGGGEKEKCNTIPSSSTSESERFAAERFTASAPLGDQIDRHTPSAEPVSPTTWKQSSAPAADRDEKYAALRRLVQYGVNLAFRALDTALEHGWTPRQIVALVDLCAAEAVLVKGRKQCAACGLAVPSDARTCPSGKCGRDRFTAEIRARLPGLVFRHLQICPPGAAILTAPQESYVRARRELGEARQHHARAMQAAATDDAVKSADAARNALELQFGHVYDALSREEKNALADEVCQSSFEKQFYARKGAAPGLRVKLLEALARRVRTEDRG